MVLCLNSQGRHVWSRHCRVRLRAMNVDRFTNEALNPIFRNLWQKDNYPRRFAFAQWLLHQSAADLKFSSSVMLETFAREVNVQCAE